MFKLAWSGEYADVHQRRPATPTTVLARPLGVTVTDGMTINLGGRWYHDGRRLHDGWPGRGSDRCCCHRDPHRHGRSRCLWRQLGHSARRRDQRDRHLRQGHPCLGSGRRLHLVARRRSAPERRLQGHVQGRQGHQLSLTAIEYGKARLCRAFSFAPAIAWQRLIGVRSLRSARLRGHAISPQSSAKSLCSQRLTMLSGLSETG